MPELVSWVPLAIPEVQNPLSLRNLDGGDESAMN